MVTGDRAGCVDFDLWTEKYPDMYHAALEGLPSEELSWKMNIEEPRAATVISRVLNNKGRVQLLPAEMEVIATLSLEINLAVAARHAENVSFASMKDTLRRDLDVLVDEPDFVKVFKFVLELGHEADEFIAYLKVWYAKYVDASLRKLKLDAFKLLSGLTLEEPWLKIACIIWCYKNKPNDQTSFCPIIYPEVVNMNAAARAPLNNMINYWHGPLSEQMRSDGMTDQVVMQWVSNATYECVNAVVCGLKKRPAQCKDSTSVEAHVGRALAPFWHGLSKKLGTEYNKCDGPNRELIPPPFAIRDLPPSPAAVAADPRAKTANKENEEIAANVPSFRKLADGSFEVGNRPKECAPKTAATAAQNHTTYTTEDGVEWITKDGVRNGPNGTSDSGLIDATLAMLHKEIKHEEVLGKLRNVGVNKPDAPRKEDCRSLTEYIEVKEAFQKGELILWGLPGGQTVKLRPYDAAAAAAKPTQPTAIYKIRDTCATVREAVYVQGQCWQEQKHDLTVVGNRAYDGTENLHPYWKVRRVSPAMSEKSRKELGKNIAINMEMKEHEFHFSTVSLLPNKPNARSIQKSTVVTVPYLTNTEKLEQGDVLAMRANDIPEKPKAVKKNQTWDSQAHAKALEEQHAKKKQKMDGAAAAKGASSIDEFDIMLV